MQGNILTIQAAGNLMLEIERSNKDDGFVFSLGDIVISYCQRDKIFIELYDKEGYFYIQADTVSYKVDNIDLLGKVAAFLKVRVQCI